MAIAFFDLDRTLLAVNSAGLWLRREVALGHVSPTDALRAAAWLARYQLGFADAEALVEAAISQLVGVDVAAYERRSRDFYELQVQRQFRPGGLDALAQHRARGERCVLLSSTSIYLAELAAADLGLDGVLCNRFEVDARGRFTGRPVGKVCFGKGKLVYAESEARAQGVALRDCTFYTDSASDLSVLEAVGTPVAVNPDPRLKRTATRRGWRVEDWGSPDGTTARVA